MQTSSTPPPPDRDTPPLSKLELTNCKEMLEGRVQVQWEMIGEDIQIRVSGRIREDQYVAFGLSGREGKSEMIGGDVVVVAYNNRTGKFIAEDYYMSDYAQCDGRKGVCPDERVGGKNDAVLVHGERKNGVTTGENSSSHAFVRSCFVLSYRVRHSGNSFLNNNNRI